MNLDVVSYHDLLASGADSFVFKQLENALLHKGIVGIKEVPHFEQTTRAYINAVRKFSLLDTAVKQRYVPDRDAGDTEGYELGAEWFKDANGHWQIDDKKASFYAFVPDHIRNKWPKEVDIKIAYLNLGELIFKIGKLVLNAIGLDESVGLNLDKLVGYGRMLHYHKENNTENGNPNWCGAHFDHGVLTGLVPAYYFRDEVEIDEPEEAGLYIMPSDGQQFEKINANDKSILLFQVGEFGQLLSHDTIRATKHRVKKAKGEIERFTFALFFNADQQAVVNSKSILSKDERYASQQTPDGSITYNQWEVASYARYRAK